MSHSKDVSRSFDEPRHAESLTKPIGSGNGYPVYQVSGDSTLCGDSPRKSVVGLPAEQLAIIATRFWAKVNKTETCWLWTGSVTGSGPVRYGQVVLPREQGVQPHLCAHRVSYELTFGVIPEGLQVNHRCDVPACVNPDHLFLGTQDDNLKDAAEKGRMSVPRRRVLTTADRLAIYAMPYRWGLNAALARQHGVSPAVISHVRCGLFVDCPDKGSESRQTQPVDPSRPFDLLHSPFQLVPSRQIAIVGEVGSHGR